MYTGEIVYKPITFKNVGALSFTYEWSIQKNQETSTPQLPSTVKSLLNKSTLLSREHFLSQERSAIFCVKTKGIILPGETVNTVFSFHSNATVGALSETWEMETIPRANIAVSPAVSQKNKLFQNSFKLKESELANLSKLQSEMSLFMIPVEFDLMTPMTVFIR